MTEEQKVTAKRFRSEAEKDILISRMLESPAELSDDDITQILADDELRDIYSISVDIKAAKRNQAEIDTSAEWMRFMPKLVKPRRWDSTILARAAAILVGVLLVSAGIFFMQGGGAASSLHQESGEAIAHHQGVEAASSLQSDSIDVKDAIVVDEHQGGQASCLHKSTAGNNRTRLGKAGKMPAHLEQQTVDVEEYVRIQQARMDNDLAMQQAEAMVNQYYAMVCLNENIEPNFDNAGKMPAHLGDGYPMDDEILTLIIP